MPIARMFLPQRRKGAKANAKRSSNLHRGFPCAFAPLREKFISASKCELHARVENPAFTTYRIWHRRVTDRRLVKIKSLRVTTDDLVLEREEIGSKTEITRLANLSKDCREAHVSLESVEYNHRRPLYLESAIEQPGRNLLKDLGSNCIQEFQIVQPPPKVLTFQRKH